jgi:RNA polymerase sigma-70 factor, ECF subfamily
MVAIAALPRIRGIAPANLKGFGALIVYALVSLPLPHIIPFRNMSLPMLTHTTLRQDLVALLPRLRRFALSLTRNGADADDLVQDTCIRAIASSADWDPAQGLDRWVFRILRNLWISEIRKRQVRLGSGQVDASETDELRTDTTAEHDLALKQLMGRLAGLPSGYSSVLLLVGVEGYSYKEAADVLDLPQGTVMSRLYRARQMLAEQLAATRQVT